MMSHNPLLSAHFFVNVYNLLASVFQSPEVCVGRQCHAEIGDLLRLGVWDGRTGSGDR